MCCNKTLYLGAILTVNLCQIHIRDAEYFMFLLKDQIMTKCRIKKKCEFHKVEHFVDINKIIHKVVSISEY